MTREALLRPLLNTRILGSGAADAESEATLLRAIELGADVIAQLDAAFPRGVAAGDRYTNMASVYR